MTSALFPNHRSSGVRGCSAPWLELVFLAVLLAGQGCHHDLPYCPVPGAVGYTAGCLEEDLCYCDPTTGVLPPPDCYLRLQAGARWHALEPVEARMDQPILDEGESPLVEARPQPIHRPPTTAVARVPDFGPPPLKLRSDPERINREAEDRVAQVVPPGSDQPPPPTASQPAPLKIVEEFFPPANDAPSIAVSAVPHALEVEPASDVLLPSAPRPTAPLIIAVEEFFPPANDTLPIAVSAVPDALEVESAPEVLPPPAPRPVPITITVALEPAAGTSAIDPEEEADMRPITITPAAEPALPPAPRPAPLKIGGASNLPSASVSTKNLPSPTERRGDRDRESAGPLQDWEAS